MFSFGAAAAGATVAKATPATDARLGSTANFDPPLAASTAVRWSGAPTWLALFLHKI
jgi:hypothetical protein